MAATKTRPTQRDLEGLNLLAESHALDDPPTLRVSNVTARATDERAATLYWQTANRLVEHGFATVSHVGGSEVLSLTADGALIQLAQLAGWETPADRADGYVVKVCADNARANGATAGWDQDLIDRRIEPLLELIYPPDPPA